MICIQQDQSLLRCFKICAVARVAQAVNDNVKRCRGAVNLHRNGLRYECERSQISLQFETVWECIRLPPNVFVQILKFYSLLLCSCLKMMAVFSLHHLFGLSLSFSFFFTLVGPLKLGFTGMGTNFSPT